MEIDVEKMRINEMSDAIKLLLDMVNQLCERVELLDERILILETGSDE